MPDLAPALYRLEKLVDGTWTEVSHCIGLLHPERYPQRLEAQGKAGRVTALDDRLQPTGKVWATEVRECPVCDEIHPAPYDGGCLL